MEGGSNGRAVNGINRNSKFRSGNEGSAHAAPPSGVEPGSGGVPSNAGIRHMVVICIF